MFSSLNKTESLDHALVFRQSKNYNDSKKIHHVFSITTTSDKVPGELENVLWI